MVLDKYHVLGFSRKNIYLMGGPETFLYPPPTLFPPNWIMPDPSLSKFVFPTTIDVLNTQHILFTFNIMVCIVELTAFHQNVNC